MNQEIHKKLTELALKRSKPFCYSCYKEAPTGQCKTCASSDLMRLLPEVGCEYGTEWIVEQILEAELEPVDMDTAFEDMIRERYPETTKVGWLELDTVSVMKDQDPISWRCAQADWESEEADESNIISFDNGSTYYRLTDIEYLIDKLQGETK